MNRTIRVFISSPSDVAEERDKAEQAILHLEQGYHEDVRIQPVRWEHIALPANEDYQTAIKDLVTGDNRVDIAVFILWSVLGSPLKEGFRTKDGALYRSGTEYEFDLMLTEYEKNGNAPIIFSYFREDDPTFYSRIEQSAENAKEKDHLWEQKRMVTDFVSERFQDAEGRNLHAFKKYSEPVSFAQMLQKDLRAAIDRVLGLDDLEKVWHEAPYRGLEAFDLQHSRIFCGRDQEIQDLSNKLTRQRELGTAFVCIVGASGSGKSSLARAGLGGYLKDRGYENEAREWRIVALIPTLRAGSPIQYLTETLSGQIPTLEDGPGGLERFESRATENALSCADLLEAALEKEKTSAGGIVCLLLIIDQMEELWTDTSLADEEREQFLTVLLALARLPNVAVVSTLRSDFYAEAHTSEVFRQLKGQEGHFDLYAPSSKALESIIFRPARLAGLRFEFDEFRNQRLDLRILQDAQDDETPLPLLQHALDELYQARDRENNLLTYHAYEELGGVRGALTRRLESVSGSLPEGSNEILERAFHLLVTISPSGDEKAARRRANLQELREGGEKNSATLRTQVVDALITARILVADSENRNTSTSDQQNVERIAVVSLAHESLLYRWPSLTKWIKEKGDLLRKRAQAEQSEERWRKGNCDDSLLLHTGVPLEEGSSVLKRAPEFLQDGTRAFIEKSIYFALLTKIEEGLEMEHLSRRIRKEYPSIWGNAVADSLSSTSPNTRKNASVLLLDTEDQSFEEQLVDLLIDDPIEDVRKAAAYTLIRRGHLSAFDYVVSEERAKRSSRDWIRRALAQLLAVADMQPTRQVFADWYQKLSVRRRLSSRRRSYVLRLRNTLAVFPLLIIPGVTFASLSAASVKWIPSAFNYSCVQSTAEALMGVFHSFAASAVVGTAAIFGVTFYRMIIGKEYEKANYLRPLPATLYAMIFSFIGGLQAVLLIAYVYNPMSLYEMGWINVSKRPGFLELLHDLFVENRSGYGFLLQSMGMGFGFSVIANHLRGGTKWANFIDQQATIREHGQFLQIVRGVIRVTLPSAWIVLSSVILFSFIAQAVMFSDNPEAPWKPDDVGNLYLEGKDPPIPEELSGDALTNYLSKEQERRRRWKQSKGGSMLGLVGDGLALFVGGYFVLVGMGVGIVIVRHGLQIAPQKIHGQSSVEDSEKAKPPSSNVSTA